MCCNYSYVVCKDIKPVNPKGNESWIFIGRTDAKAETPILWPPDVKNWLIGKDPDAGKDWRQEKGTTEDEMVGWHHRLNGHEFEQALGVGNGQGSLACCGPRITKSRTRLSNWTELNCPILCYPVSIWTSLPLIIHIIEGKRWKQWQILPSWIQNHWRQ